MDFLFEKKNLYRWGDKVKVLNFNSGIFFNTVAEECPWACCYLFQFKKLNHLQRDLKMFHQF